MFNTLFAVCLLVEDIDKSSAFYTEKMGLEINSKDGKFADFKLHGTSLAMFEKSGATAMFPAKYMQSGGGCVLAFQVEDVTKACKELTNKGVVIFEGPKTTAWGQEVAYFNDPDGNIWEVSKKSIDEKADDIFKGVIISESLENKDLLELCRTVSIKVSPDDDPKTNAGEPIWTLHTVEVVRSEVGKVVDLLSKNLRLPNWWADLSFGNEVYIVFRDKIFKGLNTDKEFVESVVAYGKAMKLPEGQVPLEG